MQEEIQKSEWNVDDEVLKMVCLLKFKYLWHIENWELEKAYWTLRLLDSEISPALGEEEQKEINNAIIELEKIRKGTITKSEEGPFYSILDSVYKKMNTYMIEAGWYFRRKELYMGL